MADQLFTEILMDIFLRLPTRILCQLTCVCKSWNSLITSPSFVKVHLARPQGSLLLFHGFCGGRREFFLLHHDNPALDKYAEFTCPFKSYFSGSFRVIGCCNGVICLTDDLDTYVHHTFLWNPWIKKCIVLPEPRVTFNSHRPYRHALGFGFDEKNNDYKVIRIVHLDSLKIPAEVDVYRLSSGTWHNISHLNLPYKLDRKAPQVYLNGAAHWLAYNQSKSQHWVVAFNMADEVFCYIGTPRGMSFSMKNLLVPPGNCEGSLTLTSWEGYGSNKIWSVWVMKDYGVVESWVKQFSVSGNPGFERLLDENNEVIFKTTEGKLISYRPRVYEQQFDRLIGYRKNDGVLFTTKCKDVISYHPRSGVQKLELSGLERPYTLFATSYCESIALLGTKRQEALDQDGDARKKDDKN